uniref:Uncharacterized protein n=1 Tax=Arundo donax TaxID=35708 RepID=A0A0A9HJA3_ARUDO
MAPTAAAHGTAMATDRQSWPTEAEQLSQR